MQIVIYDIKLEIYQKIDIYYMIDDLMLLLVNFLIVK